ncbi:MAG: hypothetical protein IPL32_20415 [Chloracidobacterium sp.]|nr:hypothetical protein [Chloracidobacterium sp.]
MTLKTKVSTTTYLGSDKERDKALAQTYPGIQFTQSCKHRNVGVTVSKFTVMDGVFSRPESLNVLCANVSNRMDV